MRLDKFLCEMNMGTRSQVKELVKKGFVLVNGDVIKSADKKIDEQKDIVCCQGRELVYHKFVYYMLNKPQGVVSATQDNTAKTVTELLASEGRKDLFPVGRLDKDTEGLLLLTNDGALAHKLLSPKKHIDKTYQVEIAYALSQEDINRLEQGVDIGEEKLTLPAKVEIRSENVIYLTIQEGKFHQVKRMLQAVDNQVTALKRIRFGEITLDEKLAPGEYRALTPKEEMLIKRGQIMKPDVLKSDMLRGIDAVIFDLDGSLVDSMWMWHEIDIEYLGRYGIELPEDLQSKIEGMSFGETAVYFKEHFPIPDPIEKIKQDWNEMAWDKYMHEVPLKAGIREFLDGCRERGIKLGIATSNSRELMENIAAVHNLKDYFTCIMTGSDVERGKPSPDIYLAVAGKLQVDPGRCLVFEDILPGIRAGKSAGMKVCAVEDEYSVPNREEKKALADYYIEDYYGFFEER